ncbi:single-stranded DNA-binding protein [Paenibacillus alkaliterrae]|uniref:single-stranded DNA-binding protein n=1 Tax=Paenibacillus alkaliterrae TaxID=320909 RepID=UPI001F235483|nr:single-stranded DNA-binding protein [Paenibacillus alkaliterrae]MCF2940666.1 single-stranded DNA-binding protein [Paenibacillus alkaliterrae]
MLNRVVLIGRLTKDPDLRYTPSGVAVTQFVLAVDRTFTSGEGEREADFIPIVMWRQLAETCANYLKKGRLTAVEGRIQVRNYESNEGKRVYVTEVIADNVRFLESANGGSGSGGSNTGSSGNSGNRSGGQGSNRNQSGGTYGGGSQSSNKGGNGGGRDTFANDGRPIDISEDDLPF